jgi:hypothetical protein
MLTQSSLVDAKLNMGRKKKPPTVQVRLAEDVVDLAWKIAPYQGYRTAGDFLSDYLRPLLQKLEAEQRSGKPIPTKPKGGTK